MKFIHPEFLWFLTLLAIPIIIHLFNFKRYKTLYFSSLQFIKHVDQKTKSTQNLKHYLILASRLLALLFLIIAFAQPFFPGTDTTAINGEKIICIYVDNSYSMQARGVEGELLSEAREKAKELVNSFDVGTKFLVFTNELAGREARFLSKIEALEKIETTNYSPLNRSVNELATWQQEQLIKHEYIPTNCPLYFFSDFQRSTSVSQEENPLTGQYTAIQLIPENTDNLYIDSVWFDEPNHQINKTKSLNFRIKNTGRESVVNAEVVIDIDKYHKTIFVDVPGNGEKSTSITYSDKSYGVKIGQIKIMDKQVFFDDAYYFSYETEKLINGLILDGPARVDNIQLALEVDQHYKITSKDISSVIKSDLNAIEVVYLNGVNSVSSGLQSMLIEFIRGGGTICLFPGNDPVTNEWNQFLDKLGLARIGNGISSGTKIKTLNYKDPFFKGMFEKEAPSLNLPAVSKIFQSNGNSSAGRTLITLQNGMSLFSYTNNQGRAFMFYSSLDPSFGTFSSDALFPSLILRVAETSKRKSPLAIQIGEDVNYPIYTLVDAKETVHVKNESYDFIPAKTEQAGITMLSINKLDNFSELVAGNFDITANNKLGTISLNYNRVESDLTRLTSDEVIATFESTNLNKVKYNELSSNKQFSIKDIDKPISYWKICIVLTLIFVIAEMLLVRFFK